MALIKLRPGQLLPLAAGFLALVLLGAILAALMELEASPTIRAGVYILDLPLGGLSRRAAEEVLQPRLDRLLQTELEVTDGRRRWSFTPAEAGIRFNLKAMTWEAYAVGRVGPPWLRWRQLRLSAQRGYRVPLRLEVDMDQMHRFLSRLTGIVERPPRDATWRITSEGRVEVVPARTGLRLDIDAFFRDLQVALERGGKPGRLLLTLHEVPPALSTAQAEALGIRERISSFRTRFDPANLNRAANIRLAAAALDLTPVLPGALFSFNQRVGPRLPESGYVEAPVVLNGRLVPGIGGGICQVSSTLYNAVLLAGLQVQERHRHSVPSAYVQPGRDAAVAYDYMDLKFSAPLDQPLLIHAVTGPDWVEVSLYGRAKPAEKIDLVVEILEKIPPPVQKEFDPGLPRQKQKVVQEGFPGYRVRVWQVYSFRGRELRRQLVSEDEYKPIPVEVKFGPGAFR
ncbi:MAG: VanW family protein [Bacillota bacterium]|nr:VanW family protein [Bacillota bacterium]